MFSLEISEDGQEKDYRLFCEESDYAKGVVTDKASMTLNYGVGNSLRLSTSPSGTSGDWSYFSLLGKTLSWDVDLSNVPCGLNATFYSVYLSQGMGYRDACATFFSATELDFMEANRYAWHTTMHCAPNDCGGAPPMGFGGTISDPRYLFHDLSGQQTDPKRVYGPGEEYTINTLMPFHASITFGLDGTGNLSTTSVKLTQGSNAIGQQYDASNEQYKGWLAKLGQQMTCDTGKGNVLVWSLWTGGLNWLESPPCGNGSNPKCTATSCQYTLSNISIV